MLNPGDSLFNLSASRSARSSPRRPVVALQVSEVTFLTREHVPGLVRSSGFLSEAPPNGSTWMQNARSTGAGAEAALPQGAGLPRGALPRRDGLLHGPTGPVRLRSCGHRPAVRREALPAPGLPGVLHTSPACGHKQICDIPTFLPIFSQGTTARFQDVGQTVRLRVACQARQRACSRVNQREQWTPSRRAMTNEHRQNARRSVPKIGQIHGQIVG